MRSVVDALRSQLLELTRAVSLPPGWQEFCDFAEAVRTPLTDGQLLQLALAFSPSAAAAARELMQRSPPSTGTLRRVGRFDETRGLEKILHLPVAGWESLALGQRYVCLGETTGIRLLELSTGNEIPLLERELLVMACYLQGEETLLVVGRPQAESPAGRPLVSMELFDIASRTSRWRANVEQDAIAFDELAAFAAVWTDQQCAVWHLAPHDPVLARLLSFPVGCELLAVSGQGRVAAHEQKKMWISREDRPGFDLIELAEIPDAASFSVAGDLLVALPDRILLIDGVSLQMDAFVSWQADSVGAGQARLLAPLARSRYCHPPVDAAGASRFVETWRSDPAVGPQVALSADGRIIAELHGPTIDILAEEQASRGRRHDRHRGMVRWLQAFAGGEVILSASWGEHNFYLWRPEGDGYEKQVAIHRAFLSSTPASGDDIVVSAGEDGSLCLWDARTLAIRWERAGFRSVRQLSVLPDGKGVGVLHGRQEFSLLDASCGDTVKHLPDLAPSARCLTWSPDGLRAAFFSRKRGSDTFDVGVLELATDEVNFVASGQEKITWQEWSQDSQTLTFSTLRGMVWVSREGITLAETEFEIPAVDVLLTIPGQIFLLDAEGALCALARPSGRVAWRVALPWATTLPYFAVSDDHRWFAVAHEGEFLVGSCASGEEIARWVGPRPIQGGLVFVGSHRLAAALDTGSVVVWEIEPPPLPAAAPP